MDVRSMKEGEVKKKKDSRDAMRKPKVLSALGRGRSQRGQSCLLDPHITLCIRYTFRLDLLLK